MGREAVGALPCLTGQSPQKDPADFLPPTTYFPPLVPVATVLLDCTTAYTEGGSVTERAAPCLPHPVISMLNLCCQPISRTRAC